jgi:glutaminyl-peptide cyclotransferase
VKQDFSNMKKILLILFLAVLLPFYGCRRTQSEQRFELDPARFEGQRAFAELKRFVGLGLRDAGTPGAANAARYLTARLKALGLETDIDEFEDQTPKGPVTFRNVIGRVPGASSNLIVVASHYDTKSGIGGAFQGANDSGSSTAVLLELAGLTAQAAGYRKPTDELIFVFFDGEECMEHYGPADGLHGSRHFVKQLDQKGLVPRVKAMILLDMVGDRNLSFTIPRNSSAKLISWVFDAAREENVRSMFSLYPYEIGDDHDPFLRAGIPAIDLIDFLYGSAPGRNDYWHTPEDRIDKITSESLQITGRVTMRLLNQVMASDPRPKP